MHSNHRQSPSNAPSGMDWTSPMMRSGKTTPYLSKMSTSIWVIIWHHMEYYKTQYQYPKRQNMITFIKNCSHFEFKDDHHIFLQLYFYNKYTNKTNVAFNWYTFYILFYICSIRNIVNDSKCVFVLCLSYLIIGSFNIKYLEKCIILFI